MPFAILFAVVLADSDPCVQFPPYEVCVAAHARAMQDTYDLERAVVFIEGHSLWNADPFRRARDEARRIECLWFHLREMRSPYASPVWFERDAAEVRGLLGDEAFDLGRVPLPLSWR